MKKILSIVLLLLTAIGCSTQNVTIEGAIVSEKSFNGRWAYLLWMYDNQAGFADSCLIENNKYHLSGKLPFEDEMLGEVLFENEVRCIGQLKLVRGQHLIADYDPQSTDVYHNVTGSPANEEMYEYGQYLKRTITEHISPLQKQQEFLSPESQAYIALQDSIAHYKGKNRAEIRRLFDRSQSPLNAISAYIQLQSFTPKDTLSCLLESLKSRFPKNINLTMVTGDSVAPMTPHSRWAHNRRAVLMGYLPPYSDTTEESSGTEETTEITEITKIEELPSANNNDSCYAIGDVVEELQLQGIKSNERLYAAKTPYILIDFWASWCTPCREEVPTIKRAVTEHPELISVYAISIDSNLNQWKNAIEKDGSESFTHVILREDNPHYDKINLLFNIQEIPANFLLDKNHRIIATNLRGEDLTKKLQELSAKSSAETTVK